MERGLLVIVSGFSGAGKGTLVKGLIGKYDNYALSISATTRQPRNGETHGREYFFVSTEEFEQMIADDRLIEYARYVGNYYGTPRDYIEDMMNQGKDVILEIEMQGAMKVKAKFPNTLTIFVSTKDASTLKQRLQGRGTATLEQIENRLTRAVDEADLMNGYDYLLINDEYETAIEELNTIIQTEHKRIHYNEEFITKIQRDLKSQFGK